MKSRTVIDNEEMKSYNLVPRVSSLLYLALGYKRAILRFYWLLETIGNLIVILSLSNKNCIVALLFGIKVAN